MWGCEGVGAWRHWGMGHGAWGMGHGAWGMGHGEQGAMVMSEHEDVKAWQCKDMEVGHLTFNPLSPKANGPFYYIRNYKLNAHVWYTIWKLLISIFHKNHPQIWRMQKLWKKCIWNEKTKRFKNLRCLTRNIVGRPLNYSLFCISQCSG